MTRSPGQRRGRASSATVAASSSLAPDSHVHAPQAKGTIPATSSHGPKTRAVSASATPRPSDSGASVSPGNRPDSSVNGVSGPPGASTSGTRGSSRSGEPAEPAAGGAGTGGRSIRSRRPSSPAPRPNPPSITVPASSYDTNQ